MFIMYIIHLQLFIHIYTFIYVYTYYTPPFMYTHIIHLHLCIHILYTSIYVYTYYTPPFMYTHIIHLHLCIHILYTSMWCVCQLLTIVCCGRFCCLLKGTSCLASSGCWKLGAPRSSALGLSMSSLASSSPSHMM